MKLTPTRRSLQQSYSALILPKLVCLLPNIATISCNGFLPLRTRLSSSAVMLILAIIVPELSYRSIVAEYPRTWPKNAGLTA